MYVFGSESLSVGQGLSLSFGLRPPSTFPSRQRRAYIKLSHHFFSLQQGRMPWLQKHGRKCPCSIAISSCHRGVYWAELLLLSLPGRKANTASSEPTAIVLVSRAPAYSLAGASPALGKMSKISQAGETGLCSCTAFTTTLLAALHSFKRSVIWDCLGAWKHGARSSILRGT